VPERSRLAMRQRFRPAAARHVCLRRAYDVQLHEQLLAPHTTHRQRYVLLCARRLLGFMTRVPRPTWRFFAWSYLPAAGGAIEYVGESRSSVSGGGRLTCGLCQFSSRCRRKPTAPPNKRRTGLRNPQHDSRETPNAADCRHKRINRHH
jgi:hypothetical protein